MLEQLLAGLLALFRREEGQDLVEYALVAVVLSVAIVTSVIVGGLPGAFEAWAAYVADAIPG